QAGAAELRLIDKPRDDNIAHVGSPIACLRLAIPLGCELQTLQSDAMPESDSGSVVPAQLSFLAIYNPTLGPTDETLEDQIVFYTSRSNRLQDVDESTTEEEVGKTVGHEKNERLRQIGLAQGMVSFASNFSAGKALEYVETDQTRVVLIELEKDWWIVASVDLTRLPADPAHGSLSDPTESPVFQYSSREMSPPQLLIQQLRRAHTIFLLHHDFSLGDLYSRVGRSSFCLLLDRFWDKFAWKWELLLSGNPIVDIYNGIKLSAGGELGVGVGEEEWGSGEREVLEDFVTRIDGLVDLVVSRFGDSSESPLLTTESNHSRWLGLDDDPRPADGVIFSGVGAISGPSLAHISQWMEWVFRHGDAAYGVGRDPTSLRRRRPRKPRGKQSSGGQNITDDQGGPHPSTPDRSFTPGIPRPLVTAAPQPIQAVEENPSDDKNQSSSLSSDQRSERSGFGTDTVMKYLTLGYGSWNFSAKSTSSPSGSPPTAGVSSKQNDSSANGEQSSRTKSSQTNEHHNEAKSNAQGRFVLGPRDDLETLDDLEEGSPASELDPPKPKSRIMRRILHVRLADAADGHRKQLQAVVYVHQPFMFTFLFDTEMPSLSSPSLYSSIHHQLGPLQKPLLASTSPTTAASRISPRTQPIYDLVYDPYNLTIRSSIPNIPSVGPSTHPPQPSRSPARSSFTSPTPATPTAPPWSRVESLAVHHRLLSTYTDTRPRPQELERTCKTSRGWWIVWVRVPHTHPAPAQSSASSSAALSAVTTDDDHHHHHHHDASSSFLESQPPPAQEAFLVRQASDYVATTASNRVSSGARFFRDLGGASSGLTGSSRAADLAPAKLVEGLGMDARRYLESLLSLNR
ncbi:hypothetical protein NUU61_008967, partial [Penicillium alfredii]